MKTRSWRFGALSCALILALAGTTLTAQAADYPTWEEVEAARNNEAATAAAVQQIGSLLDGLQAESARLGDTATALQAEAATARAALERITETERALSTQARLADERATESAYQAAQLAAALYRSSGADLTAVLLVSSSEDSDNLLYRLGAVGRVGDQVSSALADAEVDRNQAESLAAQAGVARTERDRLSVAAEEASAAATAAAEAADAAVDEQQSRLTVLYEQLASLKGTTVQLEQQYRIGLEANGGPDSGGPGADGPYDGGGGFVVPGNEVNNVAAAQYFAMTQLANMGYGSDQGNCLIWLWNRESGWRTNAYNASSGAYGIPQSLPGSKMANVGADWRTNYETQIMWGLLYIQGRYGTPCAAWAHSEAVNWY
ncbi:hypothetical protein M2152_000975 [Microbacteriaceae bacterium SG_E_30_P1]|uniref:Septal ring factor EnvC (AmiA/AmiB activator) n=1 Tax=Antiquaquibacter oligotrophicus TaxID=2880260 RepID=A0ABT6KLB9_9MICO|nr:hypothetical protein [Antiquaquibacter oligotrophicus]MDH6180793.1 hypothetical protein [Antiquaquibacter oligotrophicus]UDF13488.1 hypothetical protein LH407_01110 [Antiquaquibacter oligotrophicus]